MTTQQQEIIEKEVGAFTVQEGDHYRLTMIETEGGQEYAVALSDEEANTAAAMDIRADRYGEKFVFIPNESLGYMSEEDREALDAITESKRDYKSIGALKYGTLFCLGYNI